MKRFFIILLLFSFLLYAQEPTVENTNKRSWGIEVNPFGLVSLLLYDDDSDDEEVGFSGGISYFDNDNGVEIAMPILYLKESYWGWYDEHYTYTTNISLNYRKFLNNKTKGFHYGGFGVYTRLKGQLKDNDYFTKVDKFGIGAEIGFRTMHTDGDWSIYWGVSMRVGTYLGSDNDLFVEDTFGMIRYDNQLFWDVDFAKIGFRF